MTGRRSRAVPLSGGSCRLVAKAAMGACDTRVARLVPQMELEQGIQKSGAERKNGVDFEAHAAGISHQRGSWLACRREVLLNFLRCILPKTYRTERYMLYVIVRI